MQEKSNYGSTPQTCLTNEAAPLDSTHRTRILMFTCFLCLLVVAEGYDFGVLNGALVRMQDDLRISTLQTSLVVTATPLFVMPGTLCGGALADAFGRRAALVACCSLLVAGPLAMAVAWSIGLLLATRAVVGFGIGMGLVVVSMYIAELAPMEMRGRLIMLEDIFLNLGMALGYLMNWLLLGIPSDWRWMLGLGSVLPVVVLIVICHPRMPESPRWLVTRGLVEEAEKSLCLFVGKDEAKLAMEAMLAQLDENQEFVSWRQVLCSWHDGKIRRMLFAGIVVAVAQMGCGYLIMAYYSSTVLKKTMGEEAAFIATIVMGAVKLLVALLTLMMIESVGRRPMLMASGSVCGLACAWLAVVFTNGMGPLAQSLGFAMFMAGFSLGLGPIAFVYVSEVFVTKWRGKAFAFAVFLSRILGAGSTFAFPLLLEGIGASACFWIMASANAALIALMAVFVVETHGQALEGMEDIFET